MHALVAVDGSDASVRSLRAADSLFPSARLTAVNVTSAVPLTPPVAPGAMGVASTAAWDRYLAQVPDTTDELREVARSIAWAAIEDAGLVSRDPEASPLGEVGEAAEVIVEVARERSVDVIVVGAHDHHWWSRWFVPSVGEHVTRTSDVPVLVVPVHDD